MNLFVTYLKDYFRKSSRTGLIFTLVFVAFLIFANYTFGIEKRIRGIRPWPLSMVSFFFFYGFVLFFCWAVQYTFGNRGVLSKRFLLLLLLAPLYFAAKMVHWDLSPLLPAGWRYPWNQYALIVLQLPAKLLLLFLLVYVYWRLEGGRQGGPGEAGLEARLAEGRTMGSDLSGGTGIGAFFGLTGKNFRSKPYFLILCCLVPLVALASMRPDFLHMYPKVKNIAFISGYTKPVWPWGLLYEISYGLDFLSIELFFRGLLVIGLARYAGEYAILPMAAFYCTIHFGKPLGECVSSFFGGLALGVIALRTRSILGGLIVHLGLAWVMELGGWIGALYFAG
ncbi:MAG TPA: CPBP family intramembrane glutamic endopeptidase [Puia sp.]|nr:CPBP family intramembrane glutamic endopeptidase [Puia sp.]